MAKIDLSKIKGMFGALGAYTAMLWPVMITLGAVIVLTAAILMGRSFKAKVEKQSIPMGNEVKTLEMKVPSSKQVEIEKEYQDEYQKDANQIEQLALQSTQRDLLNYNIFPKPRDTSALLFTKFGSTYCQQIEQLVSKVNGKDCPSDDELKASLQSGKGMPAMTTYRGPTPTGKSGISDTDRIMDEICQARAKSISVYANPADIAGYLFWKDYKYADIDSSVKDCWYWQIGYWLMEDIFATVEKMNKGSADVESSAVKRVVRAGFTTPDKLRGATNISASSKTVQDRPKYINDPKDQLTEACTGRLSNDDIDIVHFSFVVILRTKDIMPFMKELCTEKTHTWHGYDGQGPEKVFRHNQITILQSSIKNVEPKSAENKNYRYGNDAISELDLVCEYVLYKKAYKEIYPQAFNPKVDESK